MTVNHAFWRSVDIDYFSTWDWEEYKRTQTNCVHCGKSQHLIVRLRTRTECEFIAGVYIRHAGLMGIKSICVEGIKCWMSHVPED